MRWMWTSLWTRAAGALVRGLGVVALLFSLVAAGRAQAPGEPLPPPEPVAPVALLAPAAQEVQDSGYRMRSDVNLVLLHMSVLDENGQFVPDLTAMDFRVYEDNALQKISVLRQEDAPVSMGLLVDNSDSMEEKRAQVNAAALALVEASNPNDEEFVAHFNDGYELDADFTAQLGVLRKALDHTESRGSTAFYDAMVNSLEHLKGGYHDKKVLIIVTDGEDNTSKYSLAQALEVAKRSSAMIYAIGLLREEAPESAERAKHALLALTRATGGSAYFPEQVDEVKSICTMIAQDIRHQYTLGYYPTNTAKDGTSRSLRVEVLPEAGGGKLTVRTRTGYFATRDGDHAE
jgi:VWFA-related protein